MDSNRIDQFRYETLIEQLQNTDLKISDLILGKNLGKGTFGSVREVTLKKLAKSPIFALKTVSKRDMEELKQTKHIESERLILEIIDHPFIIRCISQFEDQKNIYFLFERAEGGELFRNLQKQGRFTSYHVRFYLCEILLALRYLHINDIVYRDLKPENILLSRNGHIRLIDFGFSKIIEDNRTYTLCGTPEYVAPELLLNKRNGYGKSIDWWALGILIYELLTGHPPFNDTEPCNIYKKIIKNDVDFPYFIEEQSKRLILELLESKPSRRLGVKDVR